MKPHIVLITMDETKYAHFSRDDETRTELYDLETDPHEFHNQVRNSAYAEALARMRGAVIEHLIEHSLTFTW